MIRKTYKCTCNSLRFFFGNTDLMVSKTYIPEIMFKMAHSVYVYTERILKYIKTSFIL